MKHDPDYLHTERFFIESIVYDAFNPSMTFHLQTLWGLLGNYKVIVIEPAQTLNVIKTSWITVDCESEKLLTPPNAPPIFQVIRK
jgi:hypothetical protein